uniref:Uncharacterized protein n=1 Tax=Arundo donax TaxID=35708 RepID=A0A0A9EV08_ARUDO
MYTSLSFDISFMFIIFLSFWVSSPNSM